MSRTPPSRVAAALSGSVRTAKVEDTAAVISAMASAFQDDPSFAWCIPDSADRERHLPTSFQVVFDALVRHEECYCTTDAVNQPGLDRPRGKAVIVLSDVANDASDLGTQLLADRN